ncbi:MAG TPA: hypothetical protein VGO47_12160 [Chlamydiales bacterium]|jgi:hypothetical protein|nr:hypothetical protein [Chlamydiales bacterium]
MRSLYGQLFYKVFYLTELNLTSKRHFITGTFELAGDFWLKYSVIIVDEAHERMGVFQPLIHKKKTGYGGLDKDWENVTVHDNCQ